MVSQKVVIKNPTGLHLRPAGILCKEAMKYKSLITFKYRENTANAKRILEMLIYDIHWYTAFLRLISWDKALLNDKDFEALVAVGKAFCYRWDGNEWINENI